ncbi:MAG: hypothetical protein ACFFB8_14315 [Promethearchaeota archaeon]
MVEKEAKLKIIHCRICGKEYNKYSRPWGLYGARYTCSEECQKVQRAAILEKIERARKIRRQKRKKNLQILLIVCLITGFIGAGIGGSLIGSLGILIGFLIGFFGPILIYIG